MFIGSWYIVTICHHQQTSVASYILVVVYISCLSALGARPKATACVRLPLKTMDNEVVKSGTLTKQGNVRKSWKRRLFRLHGNGQLTYYKDPLKPGLGSIDVKGQCVGLLRSNQCRCQWPANVPTLNCFGVMTPTRVYHFYADMAEEADNWISVLKNTSDILRRQSSLTVNSGELYQNLQGYAGAQEDEGEGSDGYQDEISYEDVVKDTEDDSLYATLPESSSRRTVDSAVVSGPPLPERSSKHLSLADEVFQMAEELAECLSENDEILYEAIPADEDATINIEQPGTTVIKNPVFSAGDMEEGDLETSGSFDQQEELYDDVAISNNWEEAKVTVSETQVQENTCQDVAMAPLGQQMASVSVQGDVYITSEVVYDDVVVNYEVNSMQHEEEIYYAAVVSDHQEVNEQPYGDVPNDFHKITEELYDDVAVEHQNVSEELYGVVADHSETSIQVGQQQEELYAVVPQERPLEKELYGEMEESTIAVKTHESAQTLVSSQAPSRENCLVTSTVQVPLLVDIEQSAAATELKHQPQVNHHPDMPNDDHDVQGSFQYEQKMGELPQAQMEAVQAVSYSTRPPESDIGPATEIVQPPLGQQSIIEIKTLENTSESVSKQSQDGSNEITEAFSSPDANQVTPSSIVRACVSAQEAGQKLKKTNIQNSRKQQGSAAGMEKDSTVMTTVTAAWKAATAWSKSGSRQREKDEKLQKSRAVEEEAARQIAEWKALRSKLFQKRGQTVDEMMDTGSKANKPIEQEKKDAGKGKKPAYRSGCPLAGGVAAKPLPPKKPIITSTEIKQLTQQALSSKDQGDSYKQEKQSTEGRQQQPTEEKPREMNDSTQHSIKDESKDSVKANRSPRALNDDKYRLQSSGLVTNPSTVHPKSAREPPGVTKPLPPAKPQLPLSGTKRLPSTTSNQADAITSTSYHPNLPSKPPSFPAWSKQFGMSPAVSVAAEHKKQLAEWQKRRRQALAAEKKCQDCLEAEKCKREEQGKQVRQTQVLVADQAWRSTKKSQLADSQNQNLPHKKTVVTRELKDALCREDDAKSCSEPVPATSAVHSADGDPTVSATTGKGTGRVSSDDHNLQSKVSGSDQTTEVTIKDVKVTEFTGTLVPPEKPSETHSYSPLKESGQKQDGGNPRGSRQPSGQKMKNLEELSSSNCPNIEPHLSEVQIRKKKASAQKRAAALSWRLEPPPDDPIGTDASKLGDDNPLMLRKLSVLARGANALAKALAAARWIDKEIRKLIAQIQNWGSVNSIGKYEVEFGVLFEECSSIFEALSGTLKTAKKHGVVQFSGELLLQGVHDRVVVTLLKDTIPDSNADTYTYQQFRACSISVHKRKGKAFGKETQQTSQRKCFVCHNTVYPMEYISADDHPMHKSCFKCCDCGKRLDSKYASLNGKFYCKNHYEQKFKQQGGYGGFK